VQWPIDRVVRRLLPDATESDWIDPTAQVALVERQVAATWAGRPLLDIEVPGVARVVALTRMGTAQVATPDLVTQDGDVVYLAVSVAHLGEIDEHLESAGAVHS
jgi:trk system potassium uptake protein TrkA